MATAHHSVSHKLALRSHALHLGVRCKSRGLDVVIACVRAGGQFHHGCSGCLLPDGWGQSPPMSSSTHIISTLRVRTPLTANTCSQAHPWPTYIVPRCLCLICGRRCMQWLFDSFDCCLFKHSASCTSPPHTPHPFTYSCPRLSQSERAHAQPATRSPTCTVRRIHSILHTHRTPHVILSMAMGGGFERDLVQTEGWSVRGVVTLAPQWCRCVRVLKTYACVCVAVMGVPAGV